MPNGTPRQSFGERLEQLVRDRHLRHFSYRSYAKHLNALAGSGDATTVSPSTPRLWFTEGAWPHPRHRELLSADLGLSEKDWQELRRLCDGESVVGQATHGLSPRPAAATIPEIPARLDRMRRNRRSRCSERQRVESEILEQLRVARHTAIHGPPQVAFEDMCRLAHEIGGAGQFSHRDFIVPDDRVLQYLLVNVLVTAIDAAVQFAHRDEISSVAAGLTGMANELAGQAALDSRSLTVQVLIAETHVFYVAGDLARSRERGDAALLLGVDPNSRLPLTRLLAVIAAQMGDHSAFDAFASQIVSLLIAGAGFTSNHVVYAYDGLARGLSLLNAPFEAWRAFEEAQRQYASSGSSDDRRPMREVALARTALEILVNTDEADRNYVERLAEKGLAIAVASGFDRHTTAIRHLVETLSRKSRGTRKPETPQLSLRTP